MFKDKPILREDLVDMSLKPDTSATESEDITRVGVRLVEGHVPSESYVESTIKVEDLKFSRIPNKYFKGEQ
ncbi:hypothetical protein H5410_045167 [Solanum commersonii]|uniref:Uncharacterized protein n=1 Tax=Solanum commersonii TaxID=4109 RepID=A0A9J5XAX2_SOLCO|nr:hypothetical protein H5410_045167 [Solanum commersonii]